MQEIPKHDESIFRRVISWAVLLFALTLLGLRATYAEGLNFQAQNLKVSDITFSLTISILIILVFLFWFFLKLLKGKFSYRKTGLEWPLALLVIASIISCIFAPDKRTAINAALILISPIFLGLIVAQSLDSDFKIRLTLILIFAFCIASVYEGAEQFFISNQALLEQYQNDPQYILNSFGIKEGSFQQMMLEHRLKSKGVRGFFTTSNSASSFAILAFLPAVAFLMEKIKNRKNSREILLTLIAIILVLAGFVLFRSKGGILALAAAVIMVLIYLRFSNFINKYKKSVFLVFITGILLLGGLVCLYGLKTGGLPSNSLLVRWQYWTASAKIIAEEWTTGTGPGNFSYFYTRFKAPGALETVSDPHNFVFSFLSQFGILGLIAFLILIFLPLCKIFFSGKQDQKVNMVNNNSKRLWLFVLPLIGLLLLIRPFLLDALKGVFPHYIYYLVITDFIMPIVAVLLGAVLLSSSVKTPVKDSKIINACLISAVAAVLIHNMIDFAIFEPAVWTGFWIFIACLIAFNRRKDKFSNVEINLPGKYNKLLAAGIIIFTLILSQTGIFKGITTVSRLKKAQTAADNGNYELAHSYYKKAQKDRIAYYPWNMQARLYLNQYYRTGRVEYLESSAETFEKAASKNPMDYKNYEKLAEVYSLLSRRRKNKEQQYSEKALKQIQKAIKRYPELGRLHFKKAQIAEDLGKKQLALEEYRNAIEIEDAYRHQYKKMYPGEELFSRLGFENYEYAKKKVKALSD